MRFNPPKRPLPLVHCASHSAVNGSGGGLNPYEAPTVCLQTLPSGAVVNLNNCQRGRYNCSHFTDVGQLTEEGT